MTDLPAPRLLDAGDGGLVVEFGSIIDPAVNARVIALDAALAADPPPGLLERVPTYRSLLLILDPLTADREMIAARIRGLVGSASAAPAQGRCWRVPVAYGGDFGPDLGEVARRAGLSEAEVIARHTAGRYRVYMIGFAPGFIYLGGLDPALHTERRSDPRLAVPAQSIAIGGAQTGIFPPMTLPSGWHIIGRTPLRSYDPRRAGRPVPFEPGDSLRFHAVGAEDFAALAAAAQAGRLPAEEVAADG